MLRMELALFLVLAFVAGIYFTAERRRTPQHRTFSVLLIVVMVHLIFDGVTVYTVNRLDVVPRLLNDVLHRLFIGTMLAAMYLFYQYISILVEKETGKSRRRLNWAARIFLLAEELGAMLLPVRYAVTSRGNYAVGIQADVCYAGVAFYLLLSAALLLRSRKQLNPKERFAIEAALLIELTVCALQAIRHDWLISGMGLTLMTLAFYLTLENPELLQAELAEKKLSMLYLKSQVNPHFLYNTLDSIRIQAQLNGDNKVAGLLLRLADFFRLSVKVDQPLVTLDDEVELLEAYMELMCARYPQLCCEYDIDPDLGGQQVPNFILQPIVENSLLHGLKNKGYRGTVTVSAQAAEPGFFEICVKDTGAGFAPGKREAVDEMLRNYAKQPPKLTGNSVGLLNVQKRIKLLCGPACGLHYTENESGGVTAHIRLPRQ